MRTLFGRRIEVVVGTVAWDEGESTKGSRRSLSARYAGK